MRVSCISCQNRRLRFADMDALIRGVFEGRGIGMSPPWRRSRPATAVGTLDGENTFRATAPSLGRSVEGAIDR